MIQAAIRGDGIKKNPSRTKSKKRPNTPGDLISQPTEEDQQLFAEDQLQKLQEQFEARRNISQQASVAQSQEVSTKNEVDIVSMYRILIIHVVINGLSISFAAMGSQTSYECPAIPPLSPVLVVTGICGIITSILRCITSDMKGWSAQLRGVVEEEREQSTRLSENWRKFYKVLQFLVTTLQIVLGILFLYLWTTIFQLYPDVTYKISGSGTEGGTTYCNKSLFLFTFTSIMTVLGIIAFIMFCIVFSPLFFLGRPQLPVQILNTYNTYNYPSASSDDNIPIISIEPINMSPRSSS